MKSLNRFRVPGALVLLLSCILITPAQWEKKPYTEWSEKEAQKLLDDSPWAKTQSFVVNPGTGGTGRSSGSSSQTNVQINFHIRFFSAKPVRQATSRIMELKQKGAINEEFSTRLKNLANSSFNDRIVVTVVCDSEQHGPAAQEAAMLLQNHTTANLKSNTFLEVKGQKIYLQEYQSPRADGFGARFLFPRLVDGKPFITPETSEIHFYSELSGGGPIISGSSSSSSGSPTYTLNQRFKVSAMNFQGNLEY